MTLNGQFKMYGDITAAKTEEVDMEGEKRLALYAADRPDPELVELNKKRQKVYTSVEIHPNLNVKGAYLMGLAVTDSPASLGTEMLSSAARRRSSPAGRAQSSTRSACSPKRWKPSSNSEDDSDKGPGLLERVTACSPPTRSNPPTISATCTKAVETVSTKEVTSPMPACRRSSPSRPRPSPS